MSSLTESSIGPVSWLVLLLAWMVWAASVYLVETLQDNPRQEWLGCCDLGTGPDRFQSLDEELQALEALGKQADPAEEEAAVARR
jgi:hypothetical protein